MKFDDYPHGICSTAMAYQSSYQTYDYSIIFSASHNSAEYIGIKIFTKENKFIPTSKLKELFTQALEHYQAEGFTPQIHNLQIFIYKTQTLNLTKRNDLILLMSISTINETTLIRNRLRTWSCCRL